MHKCFFKIETSNSRLHLKFVCRCGKSQLVNKKKFYAELTSTWTYSRNGRSRWRNGYLKDLVSTYEVLHRTPPDFAEVCFTGFSDGYHQQPSRYLYFEEWSFGDVYQKNYIDGVNKRKVEKELGYDEYSMGR